ncbi:WhiB family transcriptional regulator [Streptomyces sp. NPDC048290]|uniref:WhiB family transcriptional regulator n=1 Tax=Streptomyces sp. NPDC048290 TaxID=3155811 RepID=UPI00342D03B5
MSHYTGAVPDTRRAPDWRTQALCAGPEYDGRRDVWFPTSGDQQTKADAKAVCAVCPVQLACLAVALREEGGRGHLHRHGIRGGLTPKQRRTLYDRARKGRQQQAAA